jgi:plastocyanin
MATVFRFARSFVLPMVMLSFVPAHSIRAMSADTQPSSAQVQVDNFTFGPETLTVPVDSTVTWLNKDDVPHVIASNDGVFRSKALDTDDKYSYTFTKPGTYEYFCSVHPKMVGKIIVVPKSQAGH